ncbi:MAG: imidazoleglycerol-phosphate dehydratase HisB [Oscillospiraceae bacterium]|jgi:imidazoleglycerol-phosphate dehydratase|nr:imidazoleglycerol-phosphate dehydratase HisB [Oscillospiraceae bacterium]
MRTSLQIRRTSETDITLRLNLDGTGASEIDTGVGFLDHMLTLFAKHARFDLELQCAGDTFVDDHHTVEDVGIVLGAALDDALGDRAGIRRYGDITLPMDETLVLAAVDISGRAYLGFDLGELPAKVGTFDTELVREFWLSVTRRAAITLHVRKIAGENTHHILEASFKAAARAISTAVSLDPRANGEIPSTKGVI